MRLCAHTLCFTLFFFGALAVLVFPAPGTQGAEFEAPTLVYPTQDDSPVWKGKIRFQWQPTGAPYYHYIVNRPDGTSQSGVVQLPEATIAELGLGEHSWAVRPCPTDKEDRLQAECEDWSELQEFEIVPAPPGSTGGLIPCGRQYDDTANTPGIDESQPCGLPHFVLLVKNLLDFALWRLGLLVIAVLAVATGFFTFFSFGAPDIFLRIKALWRSLFAGYLVALVAWLLVHLTLALLDFRVSLFGQWWQIPF